MKQIGHVAIEGVIGAGKSSLAHRLANRFSAKLIEEKFEENPFLEKFYKNRDRHAFPTQLFFLLSRFEQLQELGKTDLFYQNIVADYIFEKDKLFAYINLNEMELKLYEQIEAQLKKELPQPDLTIFLQANPAIIMQRIARRGRRYEKNISRDYIEELCEAYDYFFFHFSNTPLLIINANNIDFVKQEEAFEKICELILEKFKGTRYYNPEKELF